MLHGAGGVIQGGAHKPGSYTGAHSFGTFLTAGSSLPASEDTLLQHHAVPLNVRQCECRGMEAWGMGYRVMQRDG